MINILLCFIIFGTCVSNETFVNDTESITTKIKANCIQLIDHNKIEENRVVLTNGSILAEQLLVENNVTHKNVSSKCIVIFYYATFCPFSINAAPHFNALAKFFPDITFYALDAYNEQMFNVIHGTTGTPSLKLFHNGKLIANFNSADFSLNSLIEFLTFETNLIPMRFETVLSSSDFQGPVSSILVQEIDYVLIVCWLFIIACVLFHFSKSEYFRWFIDSIKVTWTESEPQH